MRHVLKLFFGRPSKADLRDGIMLKLEGESAARLVRGGLSIMLADERAHKFSLECKGSGGHKVCMLCKNVINTSSTRCPTGVGGYMVPMTETDVTKFELQTASSIRGIQALLRQRSLVSPGALKDLQSNIGFNYVETGMLQDPFLNIDVPAVVAWDFMHLYLCDGVFTVEFKALM
eukprot:9503997-Pyramimonas_sp.AAC.1